MIRMLTLPAETVIAASGLVSLLLGVGHLLRRAENRDVTFSFTLCTVGLLQIVGANLPPTADWGTPGGLFWIHAHSALKLALGPLLLFFFADLAGNTRSLRARDSAHFLPALLLVPVLLVLGPPVAPDFLAAARLDSTRQVFRITATASTASVALYVVLGILRFDLGSIWRAPWGRPALGVALGILCLLPALASWVLFWISPDPVYLKGAHVAGAVLIGAYVISAERYPGLFQTFRAQSRRFGKSILAGLDLPALEVRLQALMEEEFVYRDEDLTLPRLAALMDLTVHQLSRLLNEHIGQNFPTFVNGRRVVEARQLLLRYPDRTTLSIGMEVGFNSYTAFHTAFTRAEGIPPGKFRRRVSDS